MRTSRNIEGYCEVMAEVSQTCLDRELSFHQELMTIAEHWLEHAKHTAGDQSPARRLTMPTNTATANPASPTPARPRATTLGTDRGDHVEMPDAPPAPPSGIGRHRGPSEHELIALVSPRWLKVKPDAVKFSTLKQRVSKVQKARAEASRKRLICWETPDKHIIVREE